MPSTGKMNGNILGIYVGGTLVTHALSHTATHSMDPIDTTTKDSSSQEEVMPGLRGSELTASGYFAEDATYGYEDFYDAYVAGTALTVLESSGVTGDVTYSYSAYITNLSRTSEHDATIGYEVSLKPTGSITKGTVSA